MKPYPNIRLTDTPDKADIRNEGRKSSVGRIPRDSTKSRFVDNVVRHADGTPGRRITKVVHNERGSFKNRAAKRATRRHLKKADRRAQMKGMEHE